MSAALNHAKFRALCKTIRQVVEMERTKHMDTEIAATIIIALADEIIKEAKKYVGP